MNQLVSFYFQVHQPYRLRDMRITDVGKGDIEYFDEEKNAAIFRKVAEKCYLPANKKILKLLKKYPDFHVSYSLSGVFLEQCEEYGPDVLASFQKLAETGKVEFLAETYYHSLSSLSSTEEFCEQVCKHVETIQRLFGQKPKIFRNTELIYNDEIANIVRMMGFHGIIAEGVDRNLEDQHPNDPRIAPRFDLSDDVQRIIRCERPYRRAQSQICTLLKNYRLSDDIAFRFSDQSWIGFPLTADCFTDWITKNAGHCINLFMDYETFGEHQWADTGIFEFLSTLPKLWEERGIETVTPSEALKRWGADWEMQEYNAPETISWADSERDLSAWVGNPIQDASFDALFILEDQIKQTKDEKLLDTWRRLQTSDHFYYMCTKFWSDGNVHKYFSPYDSPYEAYRRFNLVLKDFTEAVQLKLQSPTHA